MFVNTEESEPRSTAIRRYQRTDAADTLAVFLAAITETAAADYSTEQIRAWADAENRELSAWDEAMQARNSYVATVDGSVAGFSDVSADGYIDMMFVSPRHLHQGIARRLLAHIEAYARQKRMVELSADVSITARPFFERHGFVVEAEQHPSRAGVQLTNFRMRKKLG